MTTNTTPKPGVCRYCGVPLQSATALACVYCFAAHTVRCPECTGETGRIMRYRKTGRDHAKCPRCNNERFIITE